MFLVLLTLFLSLISAVLYRAGGMSQDEPSWIPKWMRHSWVRDWLCPACTLTPLFILHPSWLFILAYVALGGALSTYWDWLFGFDNYWFSGFMCGIAAFMLIWCGYVWWILLIRAILIALLWGIICTISEDVNVEEYSRGFNLSIISMIFLV